MYLRVCRHMPKPYIEFVVTAIKIKYTGMNLPTRSNPCQRSGYEKATRININGL